MQNRYDFQIGDIILEDDVNFNVPSSCYMYYILDVDPNPPNIFAVGDHGVTMKTEVARMSYLPDDCSLTVMYTRISSSMLDKQFENMGEGVTNKGFLFSKKVWDTAQNIKKLRGEQEFRYVNGKWILDKF